VGQAEGLSGYAEFEGCWLPGWRAGCFLLGLKADCVPDWRAVWLPSGMKADCVLVGELSGCCWVAAAWGLVGPSLVWVVQAQAHWAPVEA